jgi:serine/threonine protein kinase
MTPPYPSGEAGRISSDDLVLSARAGMSTASRAGSGRPEKSVLLDRAYESYCLRCDAGEKPDPDEFCARFPAYQTSLRRLIEAHRFFEENPALLAEEHTARWPQPGDLFLGFELVRELGRGAFARVFLAEEPALGYRRVAVKISMRGAAEAETLGRVSHPNIVPVHSVQQDPESGLTAVCMPYLGGATLCDVLDRITSSPRVPRGAEVLAEAINDARAGEETGDSDQKREQALAGGSYVDAVLRIGVQLAEALAWIHAQGICHRDLKPSNVLLSCDGRPKLLDFNLSFDERLATTRLGGTVPYMSPEQLLAMDEEGHPEASLIDARSDVYSLGVILFQLLSAAHPFGEIPLKLSTKDLRRHLLEKQQQGPRPLRSANGQLDRALARLLESCLAYNPLRRPQSAAELAAGLKRSLSRTAQLRRWARMHPVLAAGICGLAVAGTSLASHVVATREPYAFREQNRGLTAYQQGDYPTAIEHFNRALEADPRLAATAYTRGRAHQHQRMLKAALDDYTLADSIAPTGVTAASMGYCQTWLNMHEAAIASYNEAIRRGYAPAAVFNAIGYTYLVAGGSDVAKKLEAARRSLDRAIDLDPSMQAAYHNRAVVGLQAIRPPFGIREQAIKDIRRAMELGRESAQLYHDAAYIYAEAGYEDAGHSGLLEMPMIPCGGPTLLAQLAAGCAVSDAQATIWAPQAVDCLRKAAELGDDTKSYARDYLFRGLQQRPDFQALRAVKPSGRGLVGAPLVPDPAPERRLP